MQQMRLQHEVFRHRRLLQIPVASLMACLAACLILALAANAPAPADRVWPAAT